MKKTVIIAASVLLIAAGTGTYLLTKSDNKANAPSQEQASNNSSPSNPVANPDKKNSPVADKKVCDIFTSEDAKKILGESAKPTDSNNDKPKDVNHVLISTCTYQLDAGAGITGKSASLLARTAKDAEGSANDKAQFSSQRPSNAQEVKGYGDAAYWNVDFAELNILKGNVWYIITNGPPRAPERTLAEAITMADLIKTRL